MVAPMVLDGPINGEAFEAYVRKSLVAELRSGDIVIMDNLGSHKGRVVRDAIGLFLDAFTPQECANYFAAASYDSI